MIYSILSIEPNMAAAGIVLLFAVMLMVIFEATKK
jgi:hypothetical protein